MAGEYNVESLVRGWRSSACMRHLDVSAGRGWTPFTIKEKAASSLGALPARPPTFCVGCPERPVFSAMKLVAKDIGRPHVAMDVGCHAFASFEPFSQGNTLLGYGMSLAAAAGVEPDAGEARGRGDGRRRLLAQRPALGVASNLMNKGDGVLFIMKNGYASATGTQELLSSPPEEARGKRSARARPAPIHTIENTLTGPGVKWLRTVNNYDVTTMAKTYREAMTTPQRASR